MKTNRVYLIAAVDEKLGIGKNGQLPWKLKKDMAFFQKITMKTDNGALENMVIMGRKTWDSIPEAHRPLPGRRNVILTRRKDFKTPPGVYVYHNLKDALESADEFIADVFVIGGGELFKEAVRARNLKGVYLTRLKKSFNCDTFFPKLPRSMPSETLGRDEENGVKFEYVFYKK